MGNKFHKKHHCFHKLHKNFSRYNKKISYFCNVLGGADFLPHKSRIEWRLFYYKQPNNDKFKIIINVHCT